MRFKGFVKPVRALTRGLSEESTVVERFGIDRTGNDIKGNNAGIGHGAWYAQRLRRVISRGPRVGDAVFDRLPERNPADLIEKGGADVIDSGYADLFLLRVFRAWAASKNMPAAFISGFRRAG